MAVIVKLTNRMWFSVVCTLIDNDIRHHSGQNVVPSESTTNFDHCDINVKENFYKTVKISARCLTRAALSRLLSTTEN